jgi:hypothetical protein
LELSLKHAEGLYILLKQCDRTKLGLPPPISAIIFPKENQDLDPDAAYDEHIVQSKTLPDSPPINKNDRTVVNPSKKV